MVSTPCVLCCPCFLAAASVITVPHGCSLPGVPIKEHQTQPGTCCVTHTYRSTDPQQHTRVRRQYASGGEISQTARRSTAAVRWLASM
eukprot:scaffold270323_cov32-Prasinocladus_malaysianus.AAC.2